MVEYVQDNPSLYFAIPMFYLMCGLFITLIWGFYMGRSGDDSIHLYDFGVLMFWPLFALRMFTSLVLLTATNSGRLLRAGVTKPLPFAGRLLKSTAQELFSRR